MKTSHDLSFDEIEMMDFSRMAALQAVKLWHCLVCHVG